MSVMSHSAYTEGVFGEKRAGEPMDQEKRIRSVGNVAQQATAVFADAEILAVKKCR